MRVELLFFNFTERLLSLLHKQRAMAGAAHHQPIYQLCLLPEELSDQV